ncbi:MAG: cardiolipin synthase, partial [Lentimonas sp.]
MTDNVIIGTLTSLTYLIVHIAVILRAILRPNREPASRVAWVVVIIVIPIAGMIAYLLFGET